MYNDPNVYGPKENVAWPIKCISKFLHMAYDGPFFFFPEMNEDEVKKAYIEYIK